MQRVRKNGRVMNGSEGSIAVVVAVAMVGLLGLASLVVDLGQIATVRSNLQATADSAALAAAKALIKEDTDYPDKDVIRDANGAYNAALAAIQTAASSDPQLPRDPHTGQVIWDANGYGIAVTFAKYDPRATSSNWTLVGAAGDKSEVTSDSNANAVQVTINRAASKDWGAVSNLFAGIFGSSTTEVSATSKAYLGYIASVYKGSVQVPLALPSTGGGNPLASKSNSGGWAGWFGPDEALAAAKTIVFRDAGGYYVPGGAGPSIVDNNVTTATPLDPNQIYLFTVGQNDSTPNTIWDILTKIYTPSYTSSNPVFVDKLALGQQIYPRSEFKYGLSYIGPIFQRLQKAYYYKTTGNANTAPAAGTPWRVTLPVYGTKANPLKTSQMREGFRYLARLLSPWPTEVYACYTMPPPNIYVNGFVNADIVGVTYDPNSKDFPTGTYPKTLTTSNGYGAPISGTTTYTSPKDVLARMSNSVWNANTMTIKNVTDVSTIIPGNPDMGGIGGGLSAKEMNGAAPTNVGAFAKSPQLIN